MILCSNVLLLYAANWALYGELYYPESKTDISAYCTSCLSDVVHECVIALPDQNSASCQTYHALPFYVHMDGEVNRGLLSPSCICI